MVSCRELNSKTCCLKLVLAMCFVFIGVIGYLLQFAISKQTDDTEKLRSEVDNQNLADMAKRLNILDKRIQRLEKENRERKANRRHGKKQLNRNIAAATSENDTEKARRTRKQEKFRSPIAHLRMDLEQTELQHTRNKSDVLVWQGGEFDDTSFLHGDLTVLKSGAVKVGVAGIYEVKVHVCLDAVTNNMEENHDLRFSISISNQKRVRAVVKYERTLSRGTYDSQTADTFINLHKNDEITIKLSTWRYLYKTSDCHSLNIALIQQ